MVSFIVWMVMSFLFLIFFLLFFFDFFGEGGIGMSVGCFAGRGKKN